MSSNHWTTTTSPVAAASAPRYETTLNTVTLEVELYNTSCINKQILQHNLYSYYTVRPQEAVIFVHPLRI